MREAVPDECHVTTVQEENQFKEKLGGRGHQEVNQEFK